MGTIWTCPMHPQIRQDYPGNCPICGMHPLGQIFYAASCTVCTPNSLSQEVGRGLGAQAGQKALTEVCQEAGFTKVRRAAETPTNMVLEVTR